MVDDYLLIFDLGVNSLSLLPEQHELVLLGVIIKIDEASPCSAFRDNIYWKVIEKSIIV
jgi:hypothetical protein